MLKCFTQSHVIGQRQGYDLNTGVLPLVHQRPLFGVSTVQCVWIVAHFFLLAIMFVRKKGIFANGLSLRHKVRIILENGADSCYKDQRIHACTFR